MSRVYRGCSWLNKKKRRELTGWTYSELQKAWRLANRHGKLCGAGSIKFKKWRDNLTSIV